MSSPALKPLVELRPMMEQDLDEVLWIEYDIYSHPWGRTNFTDSISNGYSCWVCHYGNELVGYFVLMKVVDEAHLLNIGVTQKRQGMGFGTRLLHQAIEVAHELGVASLLLEVRPSNARALSLYRHYGFKQIGVRRDYYPAAKGREDALVLTRTLEEIRA